MIHGNLLSTVKAEINSLKNVEHQTIWLYLNNTQRRAETTEGVSVTCYSTTRIYKWNNPICSEPSSQTPIWSEAGWTGNFVFALSSVVCLLCLPLINLNLLRSYQYHSWLINYQLLHSEEVRLSCFRSDHMFPPAIIHHILTLTTVSFRLSKYDDGHKENDKPDSLTVTNISKWFYTLIHVLLKSLKSTFRNQNIKYLSSSADDVISVCGNSETLKANKMTQRQCSSDAVVTQRWCDETVVIQLLYGSHLHK